MTAAMIHGDPYTEDLRKFFRALRRAQRDLDLRPDPYTHYYKNEFPERFHPLMDTAAGARASGWCSNPTQRKPTPRPSTGSPATASSPKVASVIGVTTIRSYRCRERRSNQLIFRKIQPHFGGLCGQRQRYT
jgi:hypothetical protein